MIQGKKSIYSDPDVQREMREDLSNVPQAPFDFNDENGEPNRVRAYGKFLKVCYLRDGVEEPIRNVAEGELERLWARRIIK